MKKMIKCVVVCNLLLGVFPFFALAADKKIELYDNNGNYSYGKVKENGNVEIYDNKGNYSYGKAKENGNIEIYDNKGNYNYGKVKENGNVEIYDNNTGKYTYGKTK